METLKFKTSLKCGGCVANVKPKLDNLKSVTEWDIDLAQPLKVLTVKGENINENEIIEALKTSGYTAKREL